MKAPPLDPANPSPGHSFLPVPSSSAKLKTLPTQALDSAAAGSLVRFPPDANSLSEQDLDAYFIAFETSIKDLESLLTGPMEKVNRRTLNHLSTLASDLSELGARYNAFALSETAPTVSAAIERVGQAADSSYIATEELSTSLSASFAEPMRESAQFAGVVRNVLRYRILKRVQQEMTTDELNKKRALLESLERSEAEARRIDQYLSSSQQIQPPRREPPAQHRRDGSGEDTASIDSDFPPTHSDFSQAPSAKIGAPERTGGSPSHKKAASTSITNKIFGPIRHAVQGVVDVDPERTRRDTIGKTRESIVQLEQAQIASAKDVKDASASVLKDLKRFQREKEDDLKRYMVRSRQFTVYRSRPIANLGLSSRMPRARLSGQRRTRRLGRKRRPRSTRSTSLSRTEWSVLRVSVFILNVMRDDLSCGKCTKNFPGVEEMSKGLFCVLMTNINLDENKI